LPDIPIRLFYHAHSYREFPFGMPYFTGFMKHQSPCSEGLHSYSSFPDYLSHGNDLRSGVITVGGLIALDISPNYIDRTDNRT